MTPIALSIDPAVIEAAAIEAARKAATDAVALAFAKPDHYGKGAGYARDIVAGMVREHVEALRRDGALHRAITDALADVLPDVLRAEMRDAIGVAVRKVVKAGGLASVVQRELEGIGNG